MTQPKQPIDLADFTALIDTYQCAQLDGSDDDRAKARIALMEAYRGAVALPQAALDALRFYAHGHHFNIDDDHQKFDTVSGEPQNWLFSERDDDCTMIEDGSVAKAVLLGGVTGFEEPTEPIEGEVFIAALAQPQEAAEPAPVEIWHGKHKVTIYPDSVLHIWGPRIEEEMSDAPRTLQSVQDAVDWLYAAPPQPAVQREGLTDGQVTQLLNRAWQLGQTYWQQADSESYSQNAKSEVTRQKYLALVEEMVALLRASEGK